MKANILKTVLFVLLSLICMPMYPNITNDTIPAATEKMDAQRAEKLMNRLEEIKGMDRSAMSPTEKKELRKEVKKIKKELKTGRNGVYLSIGAIIIIILLLILLL